MLCPEDFGRCFLSWVRSVSEIAEGEIIPVDGRTLRRSYDRSSGRTATHTVSAWASESGIALGQVRTDEKSDEITAIPKLSGCIVTADAMGCQKKIAELITDRGADHVLAVKGEDMTLQGETSATLWAGDVTDADGIREVVAVIIRPDHDPGPSDIPVLDMPTLNLEDRDGDSRYEGVYNNFAVTGTYQISVYALDTTEPNPSAPHRGRSQSPRREDHARRATSPAIMILLSPMQ